MKFPDRPLRVTHIVSGDRWAGAEVQAYTLLRQLRQHVFLQVILLNEGELAGRCRELGIKLCVLDERQQGSSELLRVIMQQLKSFGPDLIHTHRQKENVLGSIANALTVRAASLRTVHGAPEFTPNGRQKLQVWLDRFCARYLQQAVIAVSADLKVKLQCSFPIDRLQVISNGIDPAEVRAAISTPDFRRGEAEALHIGLVGRLDPVKRVDIFLEMAAILLQRDPQKSWRFHVFGEGALLEPLRAQAQQLGLGDALVFHGHRSDIRSCIAALDAMVMPSDHEGLPMAALECLALGTPLIAHHTGGLPELLAASPSSLVREHSAAGYAEAVMAMLQKDRQDTALPTDYLASSNALKVLSLYQNLLRRPQTQGQALLARK